MQETWQWFGLAQLSLGLLPYIPVPQAPHSPTLPAYVILAGNEHVAQHAALASARSQPPAS